MCSVGVMPIVDRMRINRSRWLGHVISKGDSETVRVVMEMNLKSETRKVRPEKN